MAPQPPGTKGPSGSAATPLPVKAQAGRTIISGPSSQSVGESRQAAVSAAAGRRLTRAPVNAQPFNPVVGNPPYAGPTAPLKPGPDRRRSNVGVTNKTRVPLYKGKPPVADTTPVAIAAQKRLRNNNNPVVVHG